MKRKASGHLEDLQYRFTSTPLADVPTFAFVLRDGLQVLNIGCRLREYVVQVVADADERKAFFKEFTHAGGAEQKHTQDDMVLSRFIGECLGCIVQLG